MPEGHPNWRPVGHDGIARVPFARDVHTDAEIEQLVERLEDGATLDVAARSIGSRGRLIRRFMEREPAFGERIDAALALGQIVYQDRLRATARARATDLENGSDRLLEVELATHVPGYEHLRRDRVKVDGQVRHEHALVLTPELIERLPVEKLKALDEILAELETIEQPPRQLPPGSDT